ncbi:hypothetical protein [Viridibacillus sp. FSL H8-0123]|uniref:hypothetical protein n=1 Tax=Viridibacillus sp. FSL H8-0123 TaxID=1928922 RepID=UPI00096EC562|nr:hypothetical protein [Viridibacillus sp. FSL H8-0123]OMC84144.1 hypothetical protein BK130_06520 [Viridibacillus sp. FSL H8-0123]
MIITISAVLGTVAQVFAFDILTGRLGKLHLIRICLAVAAIFMIAMIQLSSYALVLSVTLGIFLTFDLIRPAPTTYLSKITDNEQYKCRKHYRTAIAGILFNINVQY